MPRLDESRAELIEALGDRYGPPPSQGGGPDFASNPFESLAEAAIGLLVEPRMVPAAVAVLRDAGWLDPSALAAANPLEIDESFRSSKVRLTARSLNPLIRLARWASKVGFDTEMARSTSTESLRDSWRAINGVGAATADRFLLRGLGRAAYPVDRATYRILVRHGWLDSSADYDEARAIAEGLAPDEPGLLQFLAEAFERLGRDCCKPTVAHCERCPIRTLLPPDGPRELGD